MLCCMLYGYAIFYAKENMDLGVGNGHDFDDNLNWFRVNLESNGLDSD